MNYKSIKDDINERMRNIKSVFEPTDDMIKIAWLVSHIEELVRLFNKVERLRSKVCLCDCLTKTPEFKYHNKNCKVYMSGRIKELESIHK